MMIQKAILHVLDFGTSMCLLSQKELDLSIETVYDYVSKRVEKSLHDPAGQRVYFMKRRQLNGSWKPMYPKTYPFRSWPTVWLKRFSRA